MSDGHFFSLPLKYVSVNVETGTHGALISGLTSWLNIRHAYLIRPLILFGDLWTFLK
jgi:hypothetical protein